MRRLLKKMSLAPTSLHYKLMIAFALMSLIPLLICVYFATNFIFPKYPQYFNIGTISLVIFITLIITMLGLHLAKRMINPIIRIALDAKRIASGDLNHPVRVTGEDEIGDLGKSLNVMTQKIKENIAELKNYGERTKEINIDINKKVLALSGLLQIGGLISAGADLQSIMDILVDKISHVEDTSPTAIMVINEETNTLEPVSVTNFKSIDTVKQPVPLGRGLLGKAVIEITDIIIDKNLKEPSPDAKELQRSYEIKNALIIPIVFRKKCRGLVLTGNTKDAYAYSNDNIELLKVFVKQAAVALENDALIKKAEELKVVDELTGLYNDHHIKERLEEEIRRSIMYQRPCSFMLLKIFDFELYCKRRGRVAGEAALKKIARLISNSLSPVDKAARFADNEFAIVLPERNKREANVISAEIKKKISGLVVDPKAEEPGLQRLYAYAGISENPLDGATGTELIHKARQHLEEAVKTT